MCILYITHIAGLCALGVKGRSVEDGVLVKRPFVLDGAELLEGFSGH